MDALHFHHVRKMLLNLDCWARRMFTLHRGTAALRPRMAEIVSWLQYLGRIFTIGLDLQSHLPPSMQDTLLRQQLAPIATLSKVWVLSCGADTSTLQVRGEG